MAERRRRHRNIIILVAVVLLFAAGTYGYVNFIAKPVNVDWEKDTVKVERGSVDLTIAASGTIKPLHEVKISPKVTGLLKHLLVVQGQKVKKGQLIAIMDDSNLMGQVEAARSGAHLAGANFDKAKNGNRPQEIAQAEAQVRKARDGVSFATRALNRTRALVKSRSAELARDEINATRISKLADEGALSDQEKLNAVTTKSVAAIALEQAEQELKQSEASLEQAKDELETTLQRASLMRAGSREEDIRAAQHSHSQSQGQLKFLESQLNDTRIRAPFDGIISQKYAEEGAIVTPTTSAATTSATSSSIVSLAGDLELVAYVSETDMGHLKLAQPVRIIANAYPEKEFHGTVSLIAPAAVVTANVTTFEVHAKINDDSHEMLMSGMNVNAEFLAGKLSNVLLVPTVSVISEKGKPGVLIPGKDNAPTFKAIKTGHTSGNKTQVLEGLSDGDLVYLAISKEELTKRGYQESTGFGGAKTGRMMPRHK